MQGTKINKEDLLKENRRLYRNISKRLEKVREQAFAPDTAIRHFENIRKTYGTNFTKLSKQELLNLYRDLSYINNLKSSTVSGATSSNTIRMDEAKQLIEPLSEATKEKFWEIYEKLYKESVLFENFKYDIISNAAILFIQGEDPDEIERRIEELYTRFVKSNPQTTAEEQKQYMEEMLRKMSNEGLDDVSFTDEFDDIFDEYF